MICQKCGDVCQCPMEPPPLTVPDPGNVPEAAELAAQACDAGDSEAWRDELAARLNRYRSRRKAPPPRYPSLRLPFGPAAAFKSSPIEESTPLLESAPEAAIPRGEAEVIIPDSEPQPRDTPRKSEPASAAGLHSTAKIIEFPRFAWGPPAPPPDQLAEPVIDRPRILEVPEITPPAPALGGITIEAAQTEPCEKRAGVDFPLQSAPLGRRLLAFLIDSIIIAAASVVFGLIFWKVVLVRPPQIQVMSLAAAIPGVFWAAYQYLLLVYAGTTPGIRLAGLQLVRFDGTAARRSLRRWRVLASYLSAASLGMGYVWLFLDEDGLCWHDRITHTYFAPRKPKPKTETV